MEEALADDGAIDIAKQRACNLRNLEHLLMLALCDYDIRRVELIARDIYGSNRSMPYTIAPYQKLYKSLTLNIPEPVDDLYFNEIRSRLRYMLRSIESPKDRTGLLGLYYSARNNVNPDF